MGAAFSVRASPANDVASPLEEAQGVSMVTEHIPALQRSTTPLSQLLAIIEDSDVVLCAMGQLLVDEHKFLQDVNTLLADSERPLASAIIYLFELLAHECFPTLIANMHTACHVLTHIHWQVRAYPDSVDCWDVLHTTLVDFQVCDPPVNVHTHTL